MCMRCEQRHWRELEEGGDTDPFEYLASLTPERVSAIDRVAELARAHEEKVSRSYRDGTYRQPGKFWILHLQFDDENYDTDVAPHGLPPFDAEQQQLADAYNALPLHDRVIAIAKYDALQLTPCERCFHA